MVNMMTKAQYAFAIGFAMSIASAVALWWSASRCRTARPPSVWATQWLTTTVAMCLVVAVLVSGSLIVTALAALLPDAMTAVVAGMLGTAAVVLGTVRALGPLPADIDENHRRTAPGGPSIRA